MWLYDFYITYFSWLSNLTRLDRFIGLSDSPSSIDIMPALIWKFFIQAPFFTIVICIIWMIGIRIVAWMIGCWFGAADDIYD